MGLGLLGAWLGYWFFTTVPGIGDTDESDLGRWRDLGAIIVTVETSFVLNRRRPKSGD